MHAYFGSFERYYPVRGASWHVRAGFPRTSFLKLTVKIFSSDSKWFKLIRSADVGDNWVLKINNLKKLHKLVTRYFEEVLDRPSALLPPVNLNAIAKDSDVRETLKLCQLVIFIAVQCDKNQIYIAKIQGLSPQSQHSLMLSIDQVNS